MKVDYSLYLVTDETGPILKGRDLSVVVREAIEGGGLSNSVIFRPPFAAFLL